MRAKTEFPESKPWQTAVADAFEIPQEFMDRCDTLFLDRDGVINRWLPGDYVKCWSEFEFLQKFLDAIGAWSRHFKRIFVVTNQRKPGNGMALQAMKDFPGVSMKHSLMIGDQDSDAQFAHNSGMYFLKVRA